MYCSGIFTFLRSELCKIVSNFIHKNVKYYNKSKMPFLDILSLIKLYYYSLTIVTITLISTCIYMTSNYFYAMMFLRAKQKFGLLKERVVLSKNFDQKRVILLYFKQYYEPFYDIILMFDTNLHYLQ